MAAKRLKKHSPACRWQMICSEQARKVFAGKCFSLGMIIREEPELIEELDEEDDLLQELCWEAQNAGITNS